MRFWKLFGSPWVWRRATPLATGDVPKPPPPQVPMPPPPPPPMAAEALFPAILLRARSEPQRTRVQAEIRQYRATRKALAARYGGRQGYAGLGGGDLPDGDALGLLSPLSASCDPSSSSSSSDSSGSQEGSSCGPE